MATVGPRRIERAEFEQRAASALADFSARTPGKIDDEVKDLLRRQVLESLIRLNLLVLEAQRTGITASPLEAEAQLKRAPFFNPGGQFDESRYQAIKQQQPAQFATEVNRIREQLAARKLNDRIENDRRPDESELRVRARRGLVRAHLEQWPLQRVDFPGSYPEPRESAVLEYYRSHAAEFQRPDRVSLSVAFVNVPSPSDSDRVRPGFMADWDRRMRHTADSLLALVKGGASFEKATESVGGPRPNVQVFPDNFPGYWNGSAAVNASLFKARPGTVLDQPVSAKEGWLLVRVDDLRPASIAPLADVARQIRGRLRADARLHRDENAARALYASRRDSLRGPAWRVRLAWTDTSRIRVPEPTANDLDRYYRSRVADYSSFDARAGRIVARPFEVVKDEIRTRWMRDRRSELARGQADQLLRAWQAGKRDPALESALSARDLPPAPYGAALDTVAAARAVEGVLWSGPDPRPVGSVAWSGGTAIWKVIDRVENHVPTFEQAQRRLQDDVRRVRDDEDERGARRLFDENPTRFSAGDVMYFSRMVMEPPDVLDVPLTRAEIEAYWREHLDRYSAPELLRARHLLVSPSDATPEADAAARKRAEGLLARIEAGEDFASLVKQYSDDPATKENGGDLGVFGRGAMLEPFERAAFAMRPGQRSGLVKTEVGYHIIEVIEHEPAVVHPIELAYANVGTDLATEKAAKLGELRADSLLRTLRTVADARALGARLKLPIEPLTRRMGEYPPGTMGEFYRGVEKVKPGQLDRRVWKPKGLGFWIVWVDSITPPAAPSWDEARAKALDVYRAGAGARALTAKRAELDSMLASGWSVDSLARLWGGWIDAPNIAPGQGLPHMGGGDVVDSLVFGGRKAAVLSEGDVSAWMELPLGLVKVRLLQRQEPARGDLDRDFQRMRMEEMEHNLVDYFSGLQQRWPVKILDARLRGTMVPGPGTRR